MELTILKSKLHRATVTEANLNYMGSVSIDGRLLDQAGLLEYEQVQIVNINNGARFETYAIRGEAGSGLICLNGAAARLAQVGDQVIIMAYARMRPEEAAGFRPKVLFLDGANQATELVGGEKPGLVV